MTMIAMITIIAGDVLVPFLPSPFFHKEREEKYSSVRRFECWTGIHARAQSARVGDVGTLVTFRCGGQGQAAFGRGDYFSSALRMALPKRITWSESPVA